MFRGIPQLIILSNPLDDYHAVADRVCSEEGMTGATVWASKPWTTLSLPHLQTWTTCTRHEKLNYVLSPCSGTGIYLSIPP